jgi:uncharacterized protein (TIGR01370 family)
MRNCLKQFLTLLCCLTGCSQINNSPTVIRNWAVYYSNALPASAFEGLDLVVFDRRYHPDFKTLQPRTKVLAYVSMGEIYDDVSEKDDLARDNLLLFKNEKWNSHAVDLTSGRWQRMIKFYVEDAISRGFDGVMLDTVDSPLYWAKQENPIRYQAMQVAARNIIRDIRAQHPDKKIMLNHGLSILEQVEPDLDYALAESILTHKDDFTGQFQWLQAKAYANAVAQLHTIVARTGNIQVLTLDYWDMGDGDGVQRIYKQQRASGFTPYVTTPDLTRFTPEKPNDEPVESAR